MNWNRPDEISVRPVTDSQLLDGSARFVAVSTFKNAPGVLVKVNWNTPLVSLPGLVRVTGEAGGAATNARLWTALEPLKTKMRR